MPKILIEVDVPEGYDRDQLVKFGGYNPLKFMPHRFIEPTQGAAAWRVTAPVTKKVHLQFSPPCGGRDMVDRGYVIEPLYTQPPTAQSVAERDELLLIESVLKGYDDSMARNDALRAVRKLLSATPTATARLKHSRDCTSIRGIGRCDCGVTPFPPTASAEGAASE